MKHINLNDLKSYAAFTAEMPMKTVPSAPRIEIISFCKRPTSQKEIYEHTKTVGMVNKRRKALKNRSNKL